MVIQGCVGTKGQGKNQEISWLGGFVYSCC
jgi:hypothetical protein